MNKLYNEFSFFYQNRKKLGFDPLIDVNEFTNHLQRGYFKKIINLKVC